MANSTGYSISLLSGPKPTGITVIQGRANTSHTYEGLISGDYTWKVSGIVFDSNQTNYVFTGESQNVQKTVTCAPTSTPTAAATNTPTATAGPTATPTLSPNETRIGMSFILPGVNKNTALGGNANPVRNTLTAYIDIYSLSNQKLKSALGQFSVQATNTSNIVYSGEGLLGTDFVTGQYLVKIRTDNSLWKQAQGAFTIERGKSNINVRLDLITLVTGDLVQDNVLNLLDYNAMLSCYGTKSCAQKSNADLNLDAKVDEKDLNIFYSALANREGD
jgi:hypothetical protein